MPRSVVRMVLIDFLDLELAGDNYDPGLDSGGEVLIMPGAILLYRNVLGQLNVALKILPQVFPIPGKEDISLRAPVPA